MTIETLKDALSAGWGVRRSVDYTRSNRAELSVETLVWTGPNMPLAGLNDRDAPALRWPAPQSDLRAADNGRPGGQDGKEARDANEAQPASAKGARPTLRRSPS